MSEKNVIDFAVREAGVRSAEVSRLSSANNSLHAGFGPLLSNLLSMGLEKTLGIPSAADHIGVIAADSTSRAVASTQVLAADPNAITVTRDMVKGRKPSSVMKLDS